MNRIEQIEKTALNEMRSKFKSILLAYGNANYPDGCTEEDTDYAVESLVDAVAQTIRHPMFVNR